MKTRLITAAVMAVVGIPILIFSKYIVFPITLALLALFAVYEMLRVLSLNKNYFLSVPAYLMALALPILAYFFVDERITLLLSAAAVLFAYLIYMFFVAVFARGKIKFADVSQAFAAVAYVVLSFGALSIMRYMKNGIWNLVIVLIAAWGSDVFAYFTGMLFGKHKLIPEISPKKTVEGSVGGIVCATLLMVLYGFIVSRATELTPNYIVLALSGLILSAVSQIGDLVASLIKRERGVKDYGNIFPGHGGVMDRFDSVVSITTILMMICIVFPPFV
ncbi:MAG: phosphatidate cytidylyltransferase [Clostridia bacterium]|nr:phosphatidate cytidylyltransferase [Clostridia bacterium]